MIYDNRQKTAALVLAAGRSTRMHSDVPKQFMEIGGKPLFIYSVEKYLKHTDLTAVVTGKEDVKTAEKWLEKFGLSSVPVIEGGAERYDSSFNGLLYLEKAGGFGRVMIHDAARAMITDEIIERCLETLEDEKAAVAAMPLKDTVKAADADGYVTSTPDRRTLRIVQTPQGFDFGLILEAYRRFYIEKAADPTLTVTDDASVAEQYADCRVKLFEGSYDNMKVTTPEDLNFFKIVGETI